MASSLLPTAPLLRHPLSSSIRTRRIVSSSRRTLTMDAAKEVTEVSSQKATRLITFLGKGGSGKTTAAVFAAQHFALTGLSTCLVIHNQDPTSEYLLDCKIGNSPIVCGHNLSAVRLETTQMLLEPLKWLKQADSRVNMTQGVLEGIVGEELGVLPGMDSVFSLLQLERFIGFSGIMAQREQQKQKFDIVIYDGISTEETIRMMGTASKARLYLKYVRSIAEKTDLGRLASPSILRLVEEAQSISSPGSQFNGRLSAEIWDSLERMLERGSAAFSDPGKFGCFIVMDPTNPASVQSALRYWGCTIQAGGQTSGAFAINSSKLDVESIDRLKENFSPLPLAFMPQLSFDSPLNWTAVLRDTLSKSTRDLLSLSKSHSSSPLSPVKFNPGNKSITLLMPGFDKSEIKLYQYRGGSELLVEAGDQRRVISLPKEIQGKVAGAKFMDRSLVITVR